MRRGAVGCIIAKIFASPTDQVSCTAATRYNRAVRKLIRLSWFLVALALYGASFFLPVCPAPFGTGAIKGYDAFLICIVGIVVREVLERPQLIFFVAAGLANPAAWFGFGSWAFGKHRAAFVAGFASLALAAPLQVCTLWEIHNPARDTFGAGYWMWLGSFVALIVAGLVGMVGDE